MAATQFLLCCKPHLHAKVGNFTVSCYSVNLSSSGISPTGSAERPWKVADARLVLEDGSIWRTKSFGASGTQVGEVIFNTSLTGCQVSRNPIGSQLCSFCYFVFDAPKTSAPQTGDALKQNHLEIILHPGKLCEHVDDVDTRAITRRSRQDGNLIGVLSTDKSHTDEKLLEMTRTCDIVGVNLISGVSCKEPYEWVDKTDREWDFNQRNQETFRVVAYDFGIKHNILRRLASYGCQITVVPSAWPASETLKMKPDGVLFSNGSGDPSAVPYAVETVKEIIGKVPVFGICMGHQLLGLALGGKTFKMKFGHHGGNHPIRNLRNGRAEISAQNHNYAVDPESLPEGVEVTHVDLNDGSNSCQSQ